MPFLSLLTVKYAWLPTVSFLFLQVSVTDNLILGKGPHRRCKSREPLLLSGARVLGEPENPQGNALNWKWVHWVQVTDNWPPGFRRATFLICSHFSVLNLGACRDINVLKSRPSLLSIFFLGGTRSWVSLCCPPGCPERVYCSLKQWAKPMMGQTGMFGGYFNSLPSFLVLRWHSEI